MQICGLIYKLLQSADDGNAHWHERVEYGHDQPAVHSSAQVR